MRSFVTGLGFLVALSATANAVDANAVACRDMSAMQQIINAGKKGGFYAGLAAFTKVNLIYERCRAVKMGPDVQVSTLASYDRVERRPNEWGPAQLVRGQDPGGVYYALRDQ